MGRLIGLRPFVIVAINILIAVGSDFESAIKGSMALSETGSRWWLSSEGVWLYGGWWNIANGLAGLVNILCMTGWWGIYSSKKKDDMLWPDMTRMYILAYDVWNFEYTYLNLPTHSWYCGFALLLAPTVAAMFWNKGGRIQNRANTLATWCMFAQVFPLFQDSSVFSVLPVMYSDGIMDPNVHPQSVAPHTMGVVAVLSILINLAVFAAIIKKAKKLGVNPYKHEIWKGTRDYDEAYERSLNAI